MKTLAVLGTSSNSGKSWLATALCAWLVRQGIRVAPFKAQNMSNNACATLEGGEIGRAQAAQAEACGLRPEPAMNPVLLKPSGALGSQVVLMGQATGHLPARDYYQRVEEFWQVAATALDSWRERCSVLVMEGAGSPVELNLMDRDIANLRPVRYTNGRWILVADIERGGVFAQIAGTWALLPQADRDSCLGVVVNKFRGDLSLFADAAEHLRQHVGWPLLGTLPYASDLRPDDEDSLSDDAASFGEGPTIAWVRFPSVANTSDAQPWRLDRGVRTEWTDSPDTLRRAAAIVLPGSKNTLSDLAWLRATGLADAVLDAAARGIPVLGICGGYQILGHSLSDTGGVAGSDGVVQGLGLLPVDTIYSTEKLVTPRRVSFEGCSWECYEIHMGRTSLRGEAQRLPWALDSSPEGEGCVNGAVWGTYLHGVFDAPSTRAAFAQQAGITGFSSSGRFWHEERARVYAGMADLLESHLNLTTVRDYVER